MGNVHAKNQRLPVLCCQNYSSFLTRKLIQTQGLSWFTVKVTNKCTNFAKIGLQVLMPDLRYSKVTVQTEMAHQLT